MVTISVHAEAVNNGYVYTKREIIDGQEVVTVFVRELDDCPTFEAMWKEENEQTPLPPSPPTPPKTTVKAKPKPVIANSDDGEAV